MIGWFWTQPCYFHDPSWGLKFFFKGIWRLLLSTLRALRSRKWLIDPQWGSLLTHPDDLWACVVWRAVGEAETQEAISKLMQRQKEKKTWRNVILFLTPEPPQPYRECLKWIEFKICFRKFRRLTLSTKGIVSDLDSLLDVLTLKPIVSLTHQYYV